MVNSSLTCSSLLIIFQRMGNLLTCITLLQSSLQAQRQLLQWLSLKDPFRSTRLFPYKINSKSLVSLTRLPELVKIFFVLKSYIILFDTRSPLTLTLVQEEKQIRLFGVARESTKSKLVNRSLRYRLRIGIPLAKKKIAELELSFLHLQQNVEIPEITLPIPTLVQNAITQVVLIYFLFFDNQGSGKEHPTYNSSITSRYPFRSRIPQFDSGHSKFMDQVNPSHH